MYFLRDITPLLHDANLCLDPRPGAFILLYPGSVTLLVLCFLAHAQTIHETADYGENKKGVGDAVSAQQHRVTLIQDYQKAMEKTLKDNKVRRYS